MQNKLILQNSSLWTLYCIAKEHRLGISINLVLCWLCPFNYYFLAQHVGHLQAKTQAMLKVQLFLPFGNESFLIII